MEVEGLFVESPAEMLNQGGNSRKLTTQLLDAIP